MGAPQHDTDKFGDAGEVNNVEGVSAIGFHGKVIYYRFEISQVMI
jgi:hypothetical protein